MSKVGNFSLLANALDCAVPISADLVKHDLRHHPATDSDGILGLWQGRLDKWALDQNMPPELKAEAQRVNEFGELFEKWREAVLDQSAATEVIESMRRERDSLVATANQKFLRPTGPKRENARKPLRLTERAREREEALEAYRTAARERDEYPAVAREALEAYRAEAREREEALEAYRTDAREREEALEAYRTAARERDESLAVAAENLKAYRAEAREREEALEAYRTASRERDESLAVAAENLAAYRIAAQERDQESAVAQANLNAYQKIDQQYHRLTRRLRWFPLSLLIPRAHEEGAAENNSQQNNS